MTIGLVTRGAQAGQAAFDVLRAVEALGAGSVAGFAVFRWRMADGRCGIATCQDSGHLGLLPDGDWQNATHAAIISSGPNRPEPLSQFIAEDPETGFVTGHRLPTSSLPDGRVVNQAALALMQAGRADASALADLLDSGPGMDAGLICLPWTGPVTLANSARVLSRDDQGQALLQTPRAACAVLHNSIHAASLRGDGLAAALAGIGMARMTGEAGAYHLSRLPDVLEVRRAGRDALEIDESGSVLCLHSADPAYFSDRARITAVYQSVPILREGRVIGRALSEVFAALSPGRLHSGPRRDFVWASL